MKIIPLSEGAFTVDQTKSFQPFAKEKDDLQQRSAGSLLVEVQPFAIIMQDDIILIDTGLGFSNAEGVLQIHQNLRKNGIEPLNVTKVLLSHLHKDHAGGIALDNQSREKALSFPNARYYIDSDEFAFALQKGAPSFIADEFAFLKDNPNTVFTRGSGKINEQISFEHTGAHSPYHRAFFINEGDQKIFYGGDVAPQLQQMKSRFTAKYDYDGKKAMELRRDWWERGQKEGWTFLFYHDIKTPIQVL